MPSTSRRARAPAPHHHSFVSSLSQTPACSHAHQAHPETQHCPSPPPAEGVTQTNGAGKVSRSTQAKGLHHRTQGTHEEHKGTTGLQPPPTPGTFPSLPRQPPAARAPRCLQHPHSAAPISHTEASVIQATPALTAPVYHHHYISLHQNHILTHPLIFKSSEQHKLTPYLLVPLRLPTSTTPEQPATPPAPQGSLPHLWLLLYKTSLLKATLHHLAH